MNSMAPDTITTNEEPELFDSIDSTNNFVDNTQNNDNISSDDISEEADKTNNNDTVFLGANTDTDAIEVEPETEPIERKKRGPPKSILENQRKYLEALEKQQRMMNSKKNKTKVASQKEKNIAATKPTAVTIPEGSRRVIVGGKVRFIPNTPDTKTTSVSKTVETNVPIPIATAVPVSTVPKSTVPNTTPKVKVAAAAVDEDCCTIPVFKKNAMIENKRNAATTEKKIPSKYARQIESDVKKHTIKNVKSFSDLRRIKALQDINATTDMDTNKASIIELRKLHFEQRKKEQLLAKQNFEANKRDSAIADILKNDKMTKFAKTIAIKNLSVNSRTKPKKPIKATANITIAT